MKTKWKITHGTDAERINAVTAALYRFEAKNGTGDKIKAKRPENDSAGEGAFADVGNVLIGGLTFHVHNDWVFLHCGYVWEQYRGIGVYTSLVESVENVARNAGLSGIFVSTYDFEAPGLYERLGFTRGAVLHNCPEGNTSIDYYKDFANCQRRKPHENKH